MRYTGIYRAKVLATDEQEDDNIGRLKLEVYPMLISSDENNGSANRLQKEGYDIEGIPVKDLPWAVPAMSLFAGAGTDENSGYGSFTVPDIGSFVWVFFEEGDIYQPCYLSEATTKTYGVPEEAKEDYPYTKVWRTSGGFVVTIDDKEDDEDSGERFKNLKILHPLGMFIEMDKDGNINIDTSSTPLDASNVVVNVKGDTTITSTGDVVIKGERVKINP